MKIKFYPCMAFADMIIIFFYLWVIELDFYPVRAWSREWEWDYDPFPLRRRLYIETPTMSISIARKAFKQDKRA